MKTSLVLSSLAMLCASSGVFAAVAPAIIDLSNINAVKESLAPMAQYMNGVKEIAITACDPKTGAQSTAPNAIKCIQLKTQTADSAKALRTLLPLGSKIEGAFIVVDSI